KVASLTSVLHNLIIQYTRLHDYQSALQHGLEVQNILTSWFLSGAAAPPGKIRGLSEEDRSNFANALEVLLQLEFTVGNNVSLNLPEATRRSFETAQWLISSSAADALQLMAARTVSGNSTFFDLSRKLEEKRAEASEIEGLTLQAASDSVGSGPSIAISSISERRIQIHKDIKQIIKEIHERVPQYF